jgi:hypothetical protein
MDFRKRELGNCAYPDRCWSQPFLLLEYEDLIPQVMLRIFGASCTLRYNSFTILIELWLHILSILFMGVCAYRAKPSIRNKSLRLRWHVAAPVSRMAVASMHNKMGHTWGQYNMRIMTNTLLILPETEQKLLLPNTAYVTHWTVSGRKHIFLHNPVFLCLSIDVAVLSLVRISVCCTLFSSL